MPHSTSEIWPVGGHNAIFSPATRAVALVNDTAATVWRLLADLPEVPALGTVCGALWGIDGDRARTLVSSLLHGWRAAGLLPSSEMSTASGHGIVQRGGTIEVGLYATTAGRFRIFCEDPHAAVVMASVLAPLAALPGSDAPETRIDLLGTRDAYWTARNSVALTEPSNISLARHEALKQMLIDPAFPDRCTAVLHAAAVRIAGVAVVIAGDCGRGKSTLTGCLVHNGGGYIGDDMLALDRDGRHIGVCPVGLSVKIGSWSVVRPLFSPQLWSNEIKINNYRLKYVDLSHRAPIEQRIPVGAIIFPNYTAGATFSAEAIEPERSLQTLLSSGSRTAGAHPTMEGLCRLADRTPAWRLTYSDWRDAARFIEERLGAPASNGAHR